MGATDGKTEYQARDLRNAHGVPATFMWTDKNPLASTSVLGVSRERPDRDSRIKLTALAGFCLSTINLKVARCVRPFGGSCILCNSDERGWL